MIEEFQHNIEREIGVVARNVGLAEDLVKIKMVSGLFDGSCKVYEKIEFVTFIGKLKSALIPLSKWSLRGHRPIDEVLEIGYIYPSEGWDP